MSPIEQPSPQRSWLKALLRSRMGRFLIYFAIGVIVTLVSDFLRSTEEVQTLERLQADIFATIYDADPFAILNAQIATFHDVQGCLMGGVPAKDFNPLASAGVFFASVIPIVGAPFLYAAKLPTVTAQVTNYVILLAAFVLTWRFMEHVFFSGDRLFTRTRRIATAGLLLVLSGITIVVPWTILFIATKFVLVAVTYTLGSLFNLAVLFLEASALIIILYKSGVIAATVFFEMTAHERLHARLSEHEEAPSLEHLTFSAVERACDIVEHQQKQVETAFHTTLTTNARIRSAADPLVYGYTLGLVRKFLEAWGARVDDKVSGWILDGVKARIRLIFPEIEWVFHYERQHKREGDCGILLGLAEPHADDKCASLRILWTDLLNDVTTIEEDILTYYRETVIEERERASIREALRSVGDRYRSGLFRNDRHSPPPLVYGIATIAGIDIAIAVDVVLGRLGIKVDQAICTQWNAYVWYWVTGAALTTSALAGTFLILFPTPWKRFRVLGLSAATASVLALASIGTSVPMQPAESPAIHFASGIGRLMLAFPAALAGAYLSEFFRVFRRRFT